MFRFPGADGWIGTEPNAGGITTTGPCMIHARPTRRRYGANVGTANCVYTRRVSHVSACYRGRRLDSFCFMAKQSLLVKGKYLDGDFSHLSTDARAHS